jgi:hypothetical protein
MSAEFRRGPRGYDHELERALTREIVEAIARVSVVSDAPGHVSLRLHEVIEALTAVLIAMAAMNETFDDPAILDEFAQAVARRICRTVAKSRAAGTFDRFGARRGGTA